MMVADSPHPGIASCQLTDHVRATKGGLHNNQLLLIIAINHDGGES
jgi:hypothetical protein